MNFLEPGWLVLVLETRVQSPNGDHAIEYLPSSTGFEKRKPAEYFCIFKRTGIHLSFVKTLRSLNNLSSAGPVEIQTPANMEQIRETNGPLAWLEILGEDYFR